MCRWRSWGSAARAPPWRDARQTYICARTATSSRCAICACWVHKTWLQKKETWWQPTVTGLTATPCRGPGVPLRGPVGPSVAEKCGRLAEMRCAAFQQTTRTQSERRRAIQRWSCGVLWNVSPSIYASAALTWAQMVTPLKGPLESPPWHRETTPPSSPAAWNTKTARGHSWRSCKDFCSIAQRSKLSQYKELENVHIQVALCDQTRHIFGKGGVFHAQIPLHRWRLRWMRVETRIQKAVGPAYIDIRHTLRIFAAILHTKCGVRCVLCKKSVRHGILVILLMMMIAFITFNCSLVPLFEILWSSKPWEIESSGFDWIEPLKGPLGLS